MNENGNGNGNGNGHSSSSSSSDHDEPPTYDEALSDMQTGNIELLSHVEGAQRELDNLQMTINGLREALRRSQDSIV